MTPYNELAAKLAVFGIECGFPKPHQMTVSVQRGPIWPNSGNSFWLTHAKERWTLVTWTPVGYDIPDAMDVVELCRACMGIADSAMYDLPDDLVSSFGLHRLSNGELASVFWAMENAR